MSFAKFFAKNILKSIEILKKFPKIGRIVPERQNPLIREIIYKGYRIIYREINHQIEILTIIHSSKLLK